MLTIAACFPPCRVGSVLSRYVEYVEYIEWSIQSTRVEYVVSTCLDATYLDGECLLQQRSQISK